MSRGRPPKFKSAKELRDKILDYFELCNQEEKMPTKAGLALHLDTNRDVLNDYLHKGNDFSDAIKEAYDHIEDAWTQKLSTTGATGAIFYLKAAFHYSDRSEVDVTSGGQSIQPLLGGKSNGNSDDSNE